MRTSIVLKAAMITHCCAHITYANTPPTRVLARIEDDVYEFARQQCF